MTQGFQSFKQIIPNTLLCALAGLVRYPRWNSMPINRVLAMIYATMAKMGRMEGREIILFNLAF